MKLDFSILIKYLPDFGAALMGTLEVTGCSLLLGLLFSIPLSLFKNSNIKPL